MCVCVVVVEGGHWLQSGRAWWAGPGLRRHWTFGHQVDRVCVCVCVCVYLLCVCVCTHMRVHVGVCVRARERARVCARARERVRACVCALV